jgi:hypothetical protein
MTLFGFAYCSPKNPYYRNRLSDLPYNVFFEAKHEQNSYDINGESNNSNVLKYLLPDTTKGEFDSGNCIAEVELNRSNQIINVNLIGMTLFKKQTNTIIGFDRYAATSKRINSKIEPQFDEYVQFVKDMVRKLKLPIEIMLRTIEEKLT